MKFMHKLAAVAALTLALSAVTVTAWAATVYQTPAEAAAGVTGQTLEEVQTLRKAGQSYGSIAAEAGKLEEFQQAILEMRQAELEAQVADGTLTQEEADAIVAAAAERQAACNGTGTGCNRSQGTGCGAGNGMGNGNGGGHHGRGNGGGGRRSGACLYQ